MHTRFLSVLVLPGVLLLAPLLVAGCGARPSQEPSSPSAEPTGEAAPYEESSPGDDAGDAPTSGGADGEVACGGLQGPGSAPGCAEGEFCDYALDAHCGAADQSGVCRPRPEMCTREYAPVCGCDGKTHPNRCEANAAGTAVAAEGPCADDAG